MKHAILIFVHQLPEQVNVLIKQLLSYPDFDIFVHINKKNDSIRDSLIRDERVNITTNNVEVDWGSDNFIQAELLMFRELISTGIDYKQVVLVSGQDMLIRGGLDVFLDNHIEEIFSNIYEDDERRRWHVMNKWPAAYRRLIKSRWSPLKWGRSIHWQLIKHGCTLFRKKVDFNTDNIVFYKNFFWGAIPLVVIKWMVDFIDKNPSFMSIYRGGMMTEEAFTGTLIMMSPFKDWVHFDEYGIAHDLTFILKFEQSHPLIITTKDIEVLDKRKEFFARKFDIRVDKDVIDYYYKKITKTI